MKRYLRCKSTKDILHDIQSSNLNRSLTIFQLIILGIGAIIGAGIFILTGAAASQSAGPAVILSFALSGIACGCAGLCYAELSSTLPMSGSAYTYIYATLGEITAFVIGMLYIVGGFLIIATVASGWSGYAVSLLSDFNITLPDYLIHTTGYNIKDKVTTITSDTAISNVVSAAAINLNMSPIIRTIQGVIDISSFAIFDLPAFLISIIVTIILFFGIRISTFINTLIVFIKLLVLTTFVLVGITKVDPNNWVPFIPENTGEFGKFGISGILSGAAMVFFAYFGFDAVSASAQETKNPQRNVPIAIISVLLICTLAYMVIALVLTGLVNYQELNIPQPIAIAVDKMGMPWFAIAVKIGAVTGLTSVIMGITYALIRIIYVITTDGLLPRFFGKIHVKYKTPYITTIIFGILIAIISSTIQLDNMVKLGNFCIMMVFSFVCFACLYLRYTQPNLKRVFKCPLMPYIPIFGILLFGWMLFSFPNEVYQQALIIFVISLALYFTYGFKHSKLNTHKK